MAKQFHTLGPEVIKTLAQDHAFVERMRRGGSPGDRAPFSNFREKDVRLAKTTTGLDDPVYPSSPANTFVVQLGYFTYTRRAGQQTRTWTPYTGESDGGLRYAHSPDDVYYDEGSYIEVALIEEDYFILDNLGNCDVVRFEILTADSESWSVLGSILSMPSGCSDVPDSVGGAVEICDPNMCFFDEPDDDLIGRKGWAKYMLPVEANICQPDPNYLVSHWEVFSLCCPTCDSESVY